MKLNSNLDQNNKSLRSNYLTNLCVFKIILVIDNIKNVLTEK